MFLTTQFNKVLLQIALILVGFTYGDAQLSYDASAAFSLNKTNSTYTGNVLQVRRACDNQTINIGFNACGRLDTSH